MENKLDEIDIILIVDYLEEAYGTYFESMGKRHVRLETEHRKGKYVVAVYPTMDAKRPDAYIAINLDKPEQILPDVTKCLNEML